MMRPKKSAGRAGCTGVRRVVRVTDADLANPDPSDDLILKLLINDFDLLEVSDNAAWVDAVDAITTPLYRRAFEGEAGSLDRDRFRYMVLGWDREQQAAIYAELLAAFPP